MKKIVHWVMKNGSGMCNVALDMAMAERSIGLPSVALSCEQPAEIQCGLDADIHVIHTHLPDSVSRNIDEVKTVYIPHGTPEHSFSTSVQRFMSEGASASNSWMMNQFYISQCDAIVTFWERHRAIWKSIAGKRAIVEHVPMGVDYDFWKPVPGLQKWTGSPALFTAENAHAIKWPLDLVFAMPWMAKALPDMRLHLHYLPWDQHKFWATLMDRNGANYRSYVSAMKLSPENLRNAFSQVDFYLNFVRYGDYNKVCLEAKACGCKVISFAGNPYADYWIPEGDQRIFAAAMVDILEGNKSPKEDIEKPPMLFETAEGMKRVYERILGRKLGKDASDFKQDRCVG